MRPAHRHKIPFICRALAVAALVAGFCLPLSAASQGQEFRRGEVEYRVWCARCHGLTGKGDGPVAAELHGVPLDLRHLAKDNGDKFPAERVGALVDGRGMPRAHGTPEMPVWGDWFSFDITAGGLLEKSEAKTDQEIKDRVGRIVDYVTSLQTD